MSVPTSSRALARAGVGSLAALLAFALGTSPAGAAPGLTVPLSPPQVQVFLAPTENFVELPADEDGEVGVDLRPVEVGWSGTVELRLPAGLDRSAATVVLQTGSEDADEPARTLSSDGEGADRLGVTDLGDGVSRIALPADEGTGTVGVLSVEGLTGGGSAVPVSELYYFLTFTGTGTSVVSLAPQLTAYSSVPCALDLFGGSADCPPYPVAAGTTVGLTVPADSLLRGLGLGTLTDVAVALTPLDAEPEEEGGWGFVDGYDDGFTAGYDAAPGTAHVPSRGPGYDQAEAETDPAYDADYAEGHATGWADGVLAATEPEPEPGDEGDAGWAGVVGVLAGLPEPTGVPSADPAPEEAMAQVAEAALSVSEVVAAAEEPAPEVTDEVTDEATDEATGELVADGLLPVTATAEGVEVTLPADTAPGRYELAVIEGTGTTGPYSVVAVTLQVSAPAGAAPVVAPVVAPPGQPVAAPALNPGLASNTGWTEPAAGASMPLVAVGGTALLVAALGAGVVLRPRRRPAAAPQD